MFGSDGLGALDDPYEEWFTDAVPFLGGPYTIFPGREGGRGSLLRALLRGVFFDDAFHAEALPDTIGRTVLAALRLSHGVAHRASLSPGLGDRTAERDAVHLPEGDVLLRSIHAVRWQDNELAELVAPSGLADLAPLVRVAPSALHLQQLLGDEEVLRPVWHVGGEHIVSHPLNLAAHLAQWLIAAVDGAGRGAGLAAALHRSAVAEMSNAAARFGWVRADGGDEERVAGAIFSEHYWLFDRDAVAHVLVVSDDLERWAWGRHWRADLIALLRHRAAVAGTALGPDKKILTVVVTQHAGQWSEMPVGPGIIDGRHRYLGVTPEDLDVISSLDTDPLALWKFCLAAEEVQQLVEVRASSLTALYDVYRRRPGNLELVALEAAATSRASNGRPVFVLRPGAGGELRNALTDRFDRHLAPWLVPESTVAVWRHSDDPPAPLFIVERAPRAARLWEGPVGAVWIVGPPDQRGEEAQVYEAFVDVLSYWLWQLGPWSASFLAPRRRPTVLLVRLDDAGAFLNELPIVSDASAVRWARNDSGVVLEIGASLVPFIQMRSDNHAERVLMRGVLEALADASERGASPDELDQVIEVGMPLGPKRRFPTEPQNDDIDPTDLPPLRMVRPYDRGVVAREEANDIIVRGWAAGRVTGAAGVRLLNDLVTGHFVRLCARLRELRSDGLLEILITYHERFLMERALEGATLRVEALCWSGTDAVFERLTHDALQRAASAGALRFVIEAATAVAPQGEQTFDLATYDELLALSLQILELGSASDALFTGLVSGGPLVTDAGLVLPADGVDLSMQQHLRDALARQGLDRALRDPEELNLDASRDQREWEGLDRAFHAELGLSLNDLVSTLMTFYDVGERQGQPAKMLPYPDAVAGLRLAHGWDLARAAQAIAFWALPARGTLVPPPTPYASHDVYPWRHNRQLSHIRRPLLLRPRGSNHEVLWGQRQLKASGLYVAELSRRGRLRRSPGGEIDRALGRLRRSATTRFNDLVARLLPPQRFRTITRLVELDGHRIRDDTGDLGDIDVLVADVVARRLYLVETKDLGGARTPYEIAHEIGTLAGGHGSIGESMKARQERRVRWARGHLGGLLARLEVPLDDRWHVEWLLVSDVPLALAAQEPRLLTADELAARVAKQVGNLLDGPETVSRAGR